MTMNRRQRRQVAVGVVGLLGLLKLSIGQAQTYFAGVQQPEPDEPAGDLLDQDHDTLRRMFVEARFSLQSRGTSLGRLKLPIHFGNGSADVSPTIRDKLARPAEVLQEGTLRSVHLRIVGHANATGSRDLNLRLTRRRAENVRAILIEHGVPGNRLAAEGVGFDHPLEGRHPVDPLNRRVELWVIEA